MTNFLKIPYQQEIIHSPEKLIILRGALRCGKTEIVVRWAIEQMKRQKNVVIILGLHVDISHVFELLTTTLRSQRVPFSSYSILRKIRTRYGIIRILTIPDIETFKGESSIYQAFAIDNADFFSPSLYSNLNISPEASLLIAGTLSSCTMELYLTPENVGNKRIYKEINYHHMVNFGLLEKDVLSQLRHALREKDFKKSFGPWAPRNNKESKHVLKNMYD